MNINSSLTSELREKQYRDAYVSSQIRIGLPFQIRALRKTCGNMTQAALATAAKMSQPRISEIESPGGRNLNIETLLRLASGFDVALEIRFVTFSELVARSESFDPERFEVISFEHEIDALEQGSAASALDQDEGLFYRPSGQPIGYVTSETREPFADEESATVIPTPADEAPYEFAIGTDTPLKESFAFHSDMGQHELMRLSL